MATPRQDRKPPDTVRLSRQLILKHLYDPVAESENDSMSKPESGTEPESPILQPHSGSLGHCESLYEMRKGLDVLIKKENRKAHWIPEYHCDKIHPCKAMPDTPPVDTQLLERIALGQGPRDYEYEDLLAPFRRPDQSAPSAGPAGESYNELLDIVQAWNERVIEEKYGQGWQLEQRDELVEVLKQRVDAYYHAISSQTESLNIEESDQRVLAAIHAFRPETAQFEIQVPYDLLTAMIVNKWIAEPDIREGTDPMLWTWILKAMYVEKLYRSPEDDDCRTRKLQRLYADEKKARHRRNSKVLARLKVEIAENKDGKKWVVDKVLEDLEKARRVLKLKIIDDLGELTYVQTGVKLHLESLPCASYETLDRRCDMETAETEKIARARIDTVGDIRDVVLSKIQVFKDVNATSLSRARKFSGRDIANPVERAATVKKRLAHPGTITMMCKICADTVHVQQVVQSLRDPIEGMGVALQEMYDALRRRLQAEYALYWCVGGMEEDVECEVGATKSDRDDQDDGEESPDLLGHFLRSAPSSPVQRAYAARNEMFAERRRKWY